MPPRVTRCAWQSKPVDPAQVSRLAESLKVFPVTAQVLINRGVTDLPSAREFLETDLGQLADPFLMRDMDRAVATLVQAIDSGDLIRIYGDYDVDGVTATVLLVRAIKALGGRVDYYLPHRVREGYGLHREAIDLAVTDGVKLLITVDCGVSDCDEIEYARNLGIPIIVTDHHLPAAHLPPALAVLDPKRGDCGYPFKELSGVGVAFKLICALAKEMRLSPEAPFRFLDLVALGTIGDVVPLLGENRLLVKHGLKYLRQSQKPGMVALIQASQLDPRTIGSHQVSFVLAPKLNAVGRLEHARTAAELLLTADEQEADRLAGYLVDCNSQRQREERKTVQDAQRKVKEESDLSRDRALILSSEQWHPGVIGIVASRLVDQYHRPCLLIAWEQEEGKGSGRSIPGFHLWEALNQCRPYLVRFGGHSMAAGFTIQRDQVEPFQAMFSEFAAQALSDQDLIPNFSLDGWVQAGELTTEAVSQLNSLAPFGTGNPQPLLAMSGLSVLEASKFGNDQSHLKLRLRDSLSGASLPAVWFRQGALADGLSVGQSVDICFTPEIDDWRGSPSVRLKIKDLAADNLGPVGTSNPPRGHLSQFAVNEQGQSRLFD